MPEQEARDEEREALIAEAMRRTTDLDVTTNPPVTRAFIRRLGIALESAHRELVEARKHPEPEWEYGLYEEDPHRERERPHRAHNGAHLVSDNRAHVEGQWRKGHPSIKFVKRRKAGPWVSVGEGEQ